MNEEKEAQREERKPMGTLACLASGFELVARHPSLIAIPTLLDVFLWLGPRLSLAPIFSAAETFVKQLLTLEGMTAEAEEAYIIMGQIFGELAGQFNLFAVLAPAPLIGVPSLMASQMYVDKPFGPRAELVIASLFVVMFWIVVLVGLGLLLSAFYLRAVGIQIIEETEIALPGPETALALWGQLIKLSLILLIVLFGVSAFSAFLVSCVGVLDFRIAMFLVTMLSSFILFIILHLIFAVPAIVLLRRKPAQAIRESFILTRSDFFNVTLLLLLIWVIASGFNFVWSLPDPATWSMLIGIAGQAFVSTALVATLFIFFQQRLEFVETLAKAYATKEVPAQTIVGE